MTFRATNSVIKISDVLAISSWQLFFIVEVLQFSCCSTSNKCEELRNESQQSKCKLEQEIANAHRLLVFDLLVLGTRSGVTRYVCNFNSPTIGYRRSALLV